MDRDVNQAGYFLCDEPKKLRAVSDNVLIEMCGVTKNDEPVIVTLDRSERAQQLYGIVHSIGRAACIDYDVGDYVMLRLDAGIAVKIDNKEYRVLPAKDIKFACESLEQAKLVKSI